MTINLRDKPLKIKKSNETKKVNALLFTSLFFPFLSRKVDMYSFHSKSVMYAATLQNAYYIYLVSI